MRALLDDVFGDEMTEHDWEHALGGMHALRWDSGALIAHASVVQRQLVYGGRTLRTGYVEAVAVRADRRGEGNGAAVMGAVERIVHAAYDLGALGSTEQGAGFYAARGWRPWQGETWGLTPTGAVRTEDSEGSVFVLEVGTPLDLSGKLTCDWRDGDLW